MTSLHPDDENRRECLARHMFSKWTRQDIVDWLAKPKRSDAYREDMRSRLNRLKQETRKR